jgi:hypothetical protein
LANQPRAWIQSASKCWEGLGNDAEMHNMKRKCRSWWVYKSFPITREQLATWHVNSFCRSILGRANQKTAWPKTFGYRKNTALPGSCIGPSGKW